MTGEAPGDPAESLELEYELDAPPQQVWRAITIPELREHWLPDGALAKLEAAAVTPGEEVQYRMRESDPPFLESVVTFKITPNATGGTCLRVIHELARVERAKAPAVANDNRLLSMRAA